MLPAELTFGVGAEDGTIRNITVDIRDDSVVEGTESFNISASAAPLCPNQSVRDWIIMNYCSTFVRGELQSLNLDESHLKQVDPPNVTYFWRRFSQVCQTVPIWDNFQLSWMLRGQRGFNPDSNPVLSPPFLTKDGFLKLKVT